MLNGTESDVMVLNQQGRVGIGGVPVSGIALDVISGHIAIDSGYSLFLDGGSNTYIRENGADNISLFTGGSERVRINNTGLGISTDSPDTKLEVAGAHVSGIGLAHIDSTDHAFIALDAHSSSHNKGIYFQENGVHQSILEHQGSENRLRIWDGSTTYVTIGDSTGDIHTIGNISGSATSTGSFGMVMAGGTELGPSPITALNNATANRLVTVGSTTTELDAEESLTWNGSTLLLSTGTSSPTIKSSTSVNTPLIIDQRLMINPTAVYNQLRFFSSFVVIKTILYKV